MSAELDKKLETQNNKIASFEEQMRTQGKKRDQLMMCVVQLTNNCIMKKDINNVTATNSSLKVTIHSLLTRIENIESASNILGPAIPPDPNKNIILQSSSPLAESNKKRQKSIDPVCNTPNIIMGTQDKTTESPRKQKELHPRLRRTAN
eukprot:15338590-Ditylum_brightwellii.AAC.1